MARAARGSDAARVDSPDDSGGASCEAPLAADAGASVDGASKPSDAPVVAGAPIAGAAVAGANGASAESAENKPVKNIARAGGGARGDAPRDGSGDGTLSVTPDSPADSEWRARRGPLDASEGGPWASEDAAGPQPMNMYGKFTWKIENFSEISKRELRSNVFEVGGYKWYILVYPQGCDVSNHLSLFLCVADYDKLLPGWSHFAQFTIAVVNKDPKKSKYSDTLHRFCKKEHDWGWKKFMELTKVLDGFTVADTLVIKAQVQVIHEKVARPFRCLDPQYRRELVRVYLTNVEGICRRFLDEKREKLMTMRADEEQWSNLRQFWNSREGKEKVQLTMEKSDVLLKGIVKRFFNEKEVTSTLVMDALYCGCRALDIGEEDLEAKATSVSTSNKCSVAMSVTKNKCVLTGDLVSALERAADGTIFDADEDKKSVTDELSATDAVERDEKRLAELGRRTIEMYALSHVFVHHVEIAFREAEALMRQEALIAEEEEAERLAQELEGQKKSKKQKQKERQRQKKALEDAEKAEKEAAEQRQREEEQAAKEAERAAKAAAKAAALAEERAREEAEAAAKAKAEAEARAAREAKAAAKAAEKAKREAEEKAKRDAEEKAKEEARRAKEEAEAKAAAEAAAKSIPAPKSDSPSTPTRSKSISQVSSPSKVIPAPLSNEVSALRSRVSQLELQLEEKTSECKQLSADLDKAKDIILQLRSEMVSGGGVPGMRAGAKHPSMDTLGDVKHTAQAASVSLGDATNLVRMVSSSSIMSNGTSAAPGTASVQPVMATAKGQPPLPPGPPPPGSGDVSQPPPPRGPPPPGSARVPEAGPASPPHGGNSGLPPSFAAMAAASRPPEPPSAPPGMNGYGQQPPHGLGSLGTHPGMKSMAPPPGMGHPSTWSPGIQSEFPHLDMISDLLDFD